MKKILFVLCLLAAFVAISINPILAQSKPQLMMLGKGGGMQKGTVYSPPDRHPYETRQISRHRSPVDKISGVTYRVPQDYSTIQAAIDACSDGDTVLVSEGTYLENIRYKGKAIVVASLYLVDGDTTHIENTIIDGSGSTDPDSGSVVYFINGEDTTSVLCGLTIRGGYGTNKNWGIWSRFGGGVFCDSAGARLVRNYIKRNRIIGQLAYGGGLAAWGTQTFIPFLILKENRITENYVQCDTVLDWWGFGGGAIIERVSARVVGNLFERDTIVSIVGSAGGGMAILSFPWVSPLVDGYIQGNIFRENYVYATTLGAVGAGLHVQWMGEVTILDNLFEDNEAVSIGSSGWSEGGGLGITDEYITGYGRKYVIKNWFVNNRVYSQYGWGEGAGLELYMTLVTFNENKVTDNVATGANSNGGGGIYIYMSSFQLENNIITRNSVQKNGGGGVNVEGYPQQGTEQMLINNTIFDNTAQSNGGGLAVINGANVVAFNNILWANSANTGPEISVSGGAMAAVQFCDIQGGYSGIGNINVDPLFADTLGHISEQSPCIGRGVSKLDVDGTIYCAPSTDFDSNPRPSAVDTLIDLGAFETNYAAQPFTVPLSFSLRDRFIYPVTGTLHFTASILQYQQTNIRAFSKFYDSDSSMQDSVELFDDGQHGDGSAGDGLYGGSFQTNLEETFTSCLVIQNNDEQTRTEYDYNEKFTTIGPLKLDHFAIISTDTIPNPGDMIRINFFLKNDSPTATATDISIQFKVSDTLVAVSGTPVEYGDIGPGAIVGGKAQRYFALTENFTSYPTDYLPIVLEIASSDYVFWFDSLQLVVGLKESADKLPMVFQLNQNYPNPFNPSTAIKFQIPIPNFVTLEIYDLVGQKVATLVNENLNAGIHSVEWNATGFASGVYLYRLQVGKYSETKKLVLLR